MNKTIPITMIPMNTQHTAGPWKYETETKTIRSKANYWIATMDSWDGAVNHEANARLIAAAPELLAAAVACMVIVNREIPDGSIAADLRAAIAKAKGGQP